MRLPLLQQFPQLRARLPHAPFGDFPTPIDEFRLPQIAAGVRSFHVKRDDLSGRVYGGNKVRKLEFLLGAALRDRKHAVVTFGFAGSNHALATGIYAGQLGLRSTSILLPQLNAHYVRRNLLASHHFKAGLVHCPNWTVFRAMILWQVMRARFADGVFPQVIHAGGSSPLGVVGYVNAAFELRDQIAAGACPEPDVIYVPFGSMGTSAGLILGLKAAGIRSRVIAVRVIESRLSNGPKMVALCRRTAALLHGLEPSFPKLRIDAAEVCVRGDCFGGGYASFTPEAVNAAEIMKRQCGIVLNGTYSAKAFAALLQDAARGKLRGQAVLFWNTYNSRDLSSVTATVDYRQLPRPFHRYFEEEVQALDRSGLDR